MMTLEQQRQWVAKRRGETASAVDLAAGMAREREEMVARLLRGGFGSVTWRGSLLLAAVFLGGLVSCGPINIPVPPSGPICGSNKGCDCWAFYLDGDWKYRVCPTPTPTPCVCEPKPECPDGSTVQTDGHGPFPCGCPIYSCTEPPEIPSPIPTIAPTIDPGPEPCGTVTRPFGGCPAGTPACWVCQARLDWDVAHGNLTKLPGTTLYYNDIGGDPRHREYMDSHCNYVRRDGSIIRTAEQQYGTACVQGNAICPDTVTQAVPCPTPIPSVLPTEPPECPECPDIAGIGTKVQLFQLNHQAVTGHQEGDTWVANGPADKLSLDSTVYYGCGGPRCDSEHDHCLAKCEDLRGPRYRILSGPARNCQPGNPGEDGRGFALNCDVAHPSTGSWEVCTVDPWISSETGLRVGGHACKVSNWRIP